MFDVVKRLYLSELKNWDINKRNTMKKLEEIYSEFETVDLGKVIGGDGQEPDKTKKPKSPPHNLRMR